MAYTGLWDSYEGDKAAFGEDPATINPRGHQWKHEALYLGFCGWGPQTSLQKCQVCEATRGVMLHPGPNEKPHAYPGGFIGMHGYNYECKVDCPGSKEKTNETE